MINHELFALAANEQTRILLMHPLELDPLLFIESRLGWQTTVVLLWSVVVVTATVDHGVVLRDYDCTLSYCAEFTPDELV